jgi:hypothetical protein
LKDEGLVFMSNGIHAVQVADLTKSFPPRPQAGEIWTLRRSVQSSVDVSQSDLFSKPAQAYLNNKDRDPGRYVMIVKEPEPLVETADPYQEVSVMVLSSDIQYSSQIDLRLPSHLTGLNRDLLAETWHVLTMLTCNLLEFAGCRLSRSVYDLLMTVGDQDPLTQPSRQDIESVGLEIDTHRSADQSFHQEEIAWSDVLRIPVAAHRAYVEAMNAAERLMTQALHLERDLISIQAPQINLSQWLRNQFEAGWLAVSDILSNTIHSNDPFGNVATLSGARSVRTEKKEPSPEILAQLIQQLAPERPTQQQRKAARRLGELAEGYQPAIQALIDLINTTQDEEVFWTAVESLAAIAPNYPAGGVRRIKRIDLGMQIDRQAVALSVAIIQRSDQNVSILLRVYPLETAVYLPERLQLTLLDDAEQILQTVTARKVDLYIQLKLTGQVGEAFSVRVSLGDASITEDFLI